MTQISRDEIAKLAALSSLSMSDSEIDRMQIDIETLLGYVEQLNELNTDAVSPSYQVSGLQNIYRDDVVETGTTGREKLLALAPDTLNGQVKVPKVL